MRALAALVLLGALACSMAQLPPPHYLPCLYPDSEVDILCQLSCYEAYGAQNGLTGCCIRGPETVFTGLGTCRCCVLKNPGPNEPGQYYQKCSQIPAGDCPTCSCHRPTVSLTPCGQYDPRRPSLPPPPGWKFGVRGNQTVGGPLVYAQYSENDLQTVMDMFANK